MPPLFSAPRRHLSNILATLNNLACTYQNLGRHEEALRLKRDVHSGWLKLMGEEDERTFTAANNYAVALIKLERFGEGKTLLRKMMPVARRVLGEGHRLPLTMRKIYARALCYDEDATLEDLREAVATFEDSARTARRVFGGAHPDTTGIEESLRRARAALTARETPESGGPEVLQTADDLAAFFDGW